MAAFRQHIAFSSLLGAGAAVGLKALGVEWSHAVLAGTLCGLAGMLPDLDSDSGKPIHELFGVLAVVSALLLYHRLRGVVPEPEVRILAAGAGYLSVRFGVCWVFKHLTVHRGMLHSIPAALIAAELAFLAHDCPEPYGRTVLALGVLLGYMSHLVLDEISSVEAGGLGIRLNKAAGSALKCFSRSMPASLTTWLVLVLLTYAVGTHEGYLPRLDIQALYAATSQK